MEFCDGEVERADKIVFDGARIELKGVEIDKFLDEGQASQFASVDYEVFHRWLFVELDIFIDLKFTVNKLNFAYFVLLFFDAEEMLQKLVVDETILKGYL